MHKRGLSRHAMTVDVYVTFVHSVKTNKTYLRTFSPCGSQAILAFPYQTAWQYSDRNPLTGGVELRCGRRDSEPISGFAASCQCCDRPQAARCYQNDAAAQLVTHIAAAELVNGRTRRQNVYDKKSQSYAKDNRAAFIARSDKSVANVNYKTLLDVLYH